MLEKQSQTLLERLKTTKLVRVGTALGITTLVAACGAKKETTQTLTANVGCSKGTAVSLEANSSSVDIYCEHEDGRLEAPETLDDSYQVLVANHNPPVRKVYVKVKSQHPSEAKMGEISLSVSHDHAVVGLQGVTKVLAVSPPPFKPSSTSAPSSKNSEDISINNNP